MPPSFFPFSLDKDRGLGFDEHYDVLFNETLADGREDWMVFCAIATTTIRPQRVTSTVPAHCGWYGAVPLQSLTQTPTQDGSYPTPNVKIIVIYL